MDARPELEELTDVSRGWAILAVLLVQAQGSENSLARQCASLGQNLLAIKGLDLSSVVCR